MVAGLKENTGWNAKKDKKNDGAASAPKTPSTNDNVWHRIHRNIFTHREPKSVTEDDVLICNCVPSADGLGCGDECINRDVLVECDPNFCPCGSSCQNQKFQSKKYAKLDIKRTGRKGHGLFTKQPLKKGQFIIEYVGEVLHEDEYRVRKARYESEEKRHYYFMTLSSSETIDAAERGNAGRFLNHSCRPNCETQKWMVNGELCIGIYALEDITNETELTFDYNFERYGDNPIKCFCGTKKCGGWIGGGQKDGEDGDDRVDLPTVDEDDLEDYYEPAPVMLEADEEKIVLEETRGREARSKARQNTKRGLDPFAKTKDVYGNDDDDYDGDGEIALRKKEAQKEANRAAREANRGTRVSSGGGMRRSGSSSLGRKGSVGSFKRTSSSTGYMGAAYSSTSKRRSEVDVSMERLRGNSGALRNAKAAVKCIRLFNLAYPVNKDGTQSVSQRDLGLLLEAVALTTNPQTQQTLIEKGLLQALQMCIQRLGGVDVSNEHTPILRKIVKIIDAIAMNSPSLVVQRIQDTRTARGSLAQGIGDLRNAKDAGLRTLAMALVQKLPASAVAMSSAPVRDLKGSRENLSAPPMGAPPPTGNAPAMGGGAPLPPGPHPGSVTGSVSSPVPSMASNAYGRTGPPMGDTHMGNQSVRNAPDPAYETPMGARSRGPENGQHSAPHSGYTPGDFVTPGGVVPGDRLNGQSLGHGEHFNRRGLAGDGGTGDRGMDNPMGRDGGGFGPMSDGPIRRVVVTPGSGPRRPVDGGALRFDGPMGDGPVRRDPMGNQSMSSMSNQKPARPGDWLCPHGCGNVFASKQRCFKCGAPKPADARTFQGGYGGMSSMASGGAPMGNQSGNGRGPTPGGAPPGSGRKRDREEFDAPASRGGWGGVVQDDGRQPNDRRDWQPHDNRNVAPPPGMGVSRGNAPMGNQSQQQPQPPRQEPLPTHPPTTAEKWDSPLTQQFHDDVLKLMGWAIVPYRSNSHALFMPGANYDRLVAKLTNSVIEKEQTKWREQNVAIPRGALEVRLGRYCDSQVKAMHTEHYKGR